MYISSKAQIRLYQKYPFNQLAGLQSPHAKHSDSLMFFDHSKPEQYFSCCADWPQVDSLTERVEELKQDKKRLVEEYEAKLSKVQRCSHSPAGNFHPC